MRKQYETFAVATYGSKQAALDATKRAVKCYQSRGFVTQYRYSDGKKVYLFVWRSTELSDNLSMAKALGHRISERV
jgi:hypothetical protein